jgi:hypothetical protein
MSGEELMITMTLFLVIGSVLWKGIDSFHKQRMAMIDKGISVGELVGASRRGDPLPILKWGLLAIFVGAGLLLGIILNTNFRVVDTVAPVLGLIMGGIALVVYYRIASSRASGT